MIRPPAWRSGAWAAAVLVASAQAARLAAAFRSLSRTSPQLSQWNTRSANPIGRFDQPTSRAGLRGREPAVTDDHFCPEPGRLVAELAGELGPAGITDCASQVLVAEEVGDGEVLQTEPVVGLDELAGDMM